MKYRSKSSLAALTVGILTAVIVFLASCASSEAPSYRNIAEFSAATPTGLVGFGAWTRGGLGGQIIKVTNLDNEGPDSLREALRTKGPRVIVFEVAGIIDLDKQDLFITEPYVTIAGQTAPSPGISIIRGGMKIATHDVIMQHIRFRMGDAGMPKKSGYENDVAAEGPDVYNVIVDHCSVAWATDENLSVSGPRYDGPGKTARHITFSNNIIAEGLMDSAHGKGFHSMGTLVHDNVQEVAIIGNLYAHNNERNPWFKGNTTGVIVNNYIYNPGIWAMRLGYIAGEWSGRTPPEPPSVSVVGNVMQGGSNTPGNTALLGTNSGTTDGGRAWVRDNIALRSDGKPGVLLSQGIVELKEMPSWPAGLQAMPASKVIDSVLAKAGARPKDRDAVDARIIADILAGKGSFINSQEEVGGYPKVEPVYRTLEVPDSGINEWLRAMAAELE